MGEEQAKKVSFFKGIKAEFKKIVWPNRKTVIKQTYTVVVVAALLGLIIAGIDAGFQFVIFDLILANL